jgi:hypothetical protein
MPDAEVHFDETEESLIALVRAEVLSSKQSLAIHATYLRQLARDPLAHSGE